MLNAAGSIAFFAALTGNGVNASNREGIWSGTADELTLMVRSGSRAAGTESGVNYGGFGTPVLNAAGQIAFVAFVTGSGVNSSNNGGIWSGDAGALALVVREGSQAPGLPSGVNFNSFFSNSLVLNAAGQTAFFANLTGIGVTASNREGLWATDRDGLLTLIARTGNLLEVAPGDFRTIASLSFVGNTGNEDGRPSGFNDLGQLAFSARFTDGTSGVFVSDLVAVPEPSAAALLLVAAAATRRRHPRRNA